MFRRSLVPRDDAYQRYEAVNFTQRLELENRRIREENVNLARDNSRLKIHNRSLERQNAKQREENVETKMLLYHLMSALFNVQQAVAKPEFKNVFSSLSGGSESPAGVPSKGGLNPAAVEDHIEAAKKAFFDRYAPMATDPLIESVEEECRRSLAAPSCGGPSDPLKMTDNGDGVTLEVNVLDSKGRRRSSIIKLSFGSSGSSSSLPTIPDKDQVQRSAESAKLLTQEPASILVEPVKKYKRVVRLIRKGRKKEPQNEEPVKTTPDDPQATTAKVVPNPSVKALKSTSKKVSAVKSSDNSTRDATPPVKISVPKISADRRQKASKSTPAVKERSKQSAAIKEATEKKDAPSSAVKPTRSTTAAASTRSKLKAAMSAPQLPVAAPPVAESVPTPCPAKRGRKPSKR